MITLVAHTKRERCAIADRIGLQGADAVDANGAARDFPVSAYLHGETDVIESASVRGELNPALRESDVPIGEAQEHPRSILEAREAVRKREARRRHDSPAAILAPTKCLPSEVIRQRIAQERTLIELPPLRRFVGGTPECQGAGKIRGGTFTGRLRFAR